MAFLIVSSKGNEGAWKKELLSLSPTLDVRIYPDDGNKEDIEFALAWNPPLGVFQHYPNLKCIASKGAGADHIMKDPDLPTQVKITRVVDDQLTTDMSAYLLSQVLAYMRSLPAYNRQQEKQLWKQHTYRIPAKTTIGIMGMGVLGQDVARQFLELGFNLKGWTRTSKAIDGVEMLYGKQNLADFLGDLDILICLLPLTKETRNILSAQLFKMLPKGAFLINVARGEHLVEEDLLEAIQSEQLAGACLDVFRKEPLPPDHPFWLNDRIIITPHVASITSIANVAPQVLENYNRLQKGLPLLNEVSRATGY